MNRFTILTEGMMVVDISNDGGYTYYGYVRHNGEWIILRENDAATQYRVAMGAHDYETNWTNRTSLDYKLPIKE